MWHSCLLAKSKHRSTTGLGSLKTLHAPRRKSKVMSVWRSSLQPTILLALKNKLWVIHMLKQVYLSFIGITTKVPKFILKSHSASIISFCTISVLEIQVFVSIPFKKSHKNSIQIPEEWNLSTCLQNLQSSACYLNSQYSRQVQRFHWVMWLLQEQLRLSHQELAWLQCIQNRCKDIRQNSFPFLR